MTPDLVTITVTAPDADWLAEFTRGLVTDRLVACGNVVAGVRSIYAWEGEVHDDAEALVLLHTRAALVDAVIARVRADHPYDEPQVLTLPVIGTSEGYAAWIVGATASESLTSPDER